MVKTDVKKALTPECLEFVIFCVESLAEHLDRDPAEVYDLLKADSGLLENYIIPCYEPLHTQGKEYIVEDLLHAMETRGISV